MSKNIVFVGNCQANNVQSMFLKYIAPITGDVVHFVPCFVKLNQDSLMALMGADIIVSQMLDSQQVVSLDRLIDEKKINLSARIVQFPLLSGAFLWPFWGTKHPLNASLSYFSPGPYGMDYGDTYLNRELRRGSDPDSVMQSYLELDINKVKNLDRLFELHMESLKKQDAKSGFSCAEFIESKFRTEKLFQNPTTLARVLYLYLSSEIFKRIGVADSIIDSACENIWMPLSAHIELPIHPSIINYFQITYVNDCNKYVYYTGEKFDFKTYVKNYLHYNFNEYLFRSIYDNKIDINSSSERKVRISQIRLGISKSEGSGAAEFELGNLLALEGDHVGALAAYQRAYEFAPLNVRFLTFFANFLKAQGDIVRARQILESGLREWPGVAVLWHIFSEILLLQNQIDEAVEASERAVNIEPYNHDFYRSLALALIQAARLPEASRVAHQAAILMPSNPHYQDLIGQIAIKQGDLAAALQAFEAAAALNPFEPAFERSQAHCLNLQGRLQDAALHMRKAVELKPEIAENNAILAHFLASSGQDAEAWGFLQEAIRLAPGHEKYQEMAAKLEDKLKMQIVDHILRADEDGKVIAGKDGWLFLDNDSNMTIEQYKGKILLDDAKIRAWREELSWRSRFFSEKGIPYMVLIAPNKERVYGDFLPDGIIEGKIKPVDQFIEINNGVVPICFPLEELRKSRDDLEVFDKVDTHWTVLGAFIGCMSLDKEYRRIFGNSLADFKIENHPIIKFQSSGDLGQKFIPDRMAQRVAFKAENQFGLLIEDNNVHNHGNIKKYKNNFGNGKKCLIFGDSFGLNMIKVLKEYFSEVVFCHCSLVDRKIVDYEMPDIVISEHVERFLVSPPGTSEGFDINEIISWKQKTGVK